MSQISNHECKQMRDEQFMPCDPIISVRKCVSERIQYNTCCTHNLQLCTLEKALVLDQQEAPQRHWGWFITVDVHTLIILIVQYELCHWSLMYLSTRAVKKGSNSIYLMLCLPGWFSLRDFQYDGCLTLINNKASSNGLSRQLQLTVIQKNHD